MKTIHIPEKSVRPDAEIEPLLGSWMDDNQYDTLVGGTDGESTTVLKPDGSPLLIYAKDILPRSLCVQAFETFKQVDFYGVGANRGIAGGMIDPELAESDGPRVGKGLRYLPYKEDGTLSNTSRANRTPSVIVGYFDRYPRTPYCRQTAFTMDNPEPWTAAVPFIQHVSGVFQQLAPRHHAAQEEFVNLCHRDFIIPGTVFSTLTVNRNWRTALHTDEGDFRSGLGVMAVLHAGHYDGGFLVFPKYRVAVDMKTGGVALADVHSAHGNTELKGVPGRYVRISTVYYVREGIVECGSASFELERAKRVGDRVNTVHATREPKLELE
jgi:hypothetical protein